MFLMTVDEMTRLGIAWGPTLIFLLILIGGTIWGFIRGFRKSTILAVHALVALAICLTGYLIIVNNPNVDKMVVEYTNKFLGDGWIQSQMGVSASCESLKDCLIEFIPKNMNYGDGLALVLRDNGAYLASLVNMAYHIIFALVFGIIYLVLILIGYLFFYHIFYPERRYKRKKMKREAQLLDKGNGVAKPYKKRRLLGGFIGATRGLVAGLVCMSFVGALFFVIAGGTGENSNVEDNSYEFGDTNLDMANDIYKNVSHYGETGIFKLLNSLKDKDQIPYYLFASELVFQGGSKDIVDANGKSTNIALTRELTAYTSFARKTFDLVLKNDADGLVRSIVKGQVNQDEILVELSKIMAKPEFQNDFGKLIDDFDANTYFINLGVSLIDSVARNLDEFENLGLSEDVLEISNIMFDSTYKSKYIPQDQNKDKTSVIKVSNLLSVDDTKSIIKTGISLLGLDTANEDDIQKIITYSEKVLPNLSDLSILKDDSKGLFNPLLERVYTYAVNRYLPKEEGEAMINPTAYVKLVSEETGTGIDWIDEIGNAFDLALGALKIAGNVYESNPNHEPLEKTDYLEMVHKVFNKEDKNYTENNKAFTEIKNSLSTSSLLSLVMTETGMYKKLEEEIVKIAPDAYMKEDISFINRTDASGKVIPGEVSNLLTAVETALSNEKTFNALNQIIDKGLDTNDMNATLKLAGTLAEVITEGNDGSRVIDSLLNSDIFSSVLSGVVISMKEIDKENNIVLYLPNRVLEEVDGKPVNLIKRDEILTVMTSLPDLIDVVEPCLVDGKVKITPLIQGLGGDGNAALNKLLGSDIVEGTLVNAISGVLKQDSLKDFVVMPTEYLDDKGNVLVDEWLGNNEITNIINGVVASELDFDALMEKKDAELQKELLKQIEALANKEANPDLEAEQKPLTILLNSKVLHYSVSGILSKKDLIEGFEFYIPEGAYVDGNDKLIRVDQITSIVTAVPDVLEAVGPFIDQENQETYQKITPLINRLAEPGALDKILDNDIIHGTMVNTITNLLSEEQMKDMIVIPDELMTSTEVDGVVTRSANFKAWKDSNEIKNIVTAVSKSGLDLDALTAEGGSSQEAMLGQIEKLSDLEKTAAEADKPVHNLVQSKIMYYTLSGLLITEEGEESLIEGFDIFVPESSLVSGNKKLIKESEIHSVVYYLTDLLDAVNPFIEEGANKGKITPLVDRLTTNKLIDNLLGGSGIVHGTLINAIGGFLTDESVKDLIVMPDNYMVAGKPNVEVWMANEEILHVIYGIHYSGLDLDALTAEGGASQDVMLEQIEGLANKQATATENKPVDELLKSQIMHYTLSGFIIPKADGSEGLIKGVEIYVPADSLVDGNAKLIKTTEITSVIVNIPDLLDAVNPYLNEGADKGKITPLVNRLTNGGLIDKLLKSSGIVHGTLVNTIGGVLTDDSVKDLIVMPESFMTNGKPNVTEWIESEEILHVIYGIHYSGLDLDLLMNGANQQEVILDEVKKLATKQETAKEHKPVDELLKSQIMHYTLSSFIIPKTDGSEGLISGVEIYVPATSLVEGNNKLIKTTEITSVIVNIPDLLDAVNPYLNEGADKGKITPLVNRLTKDSLIDNLLNSSDIVHGTLVNTIGDVLSGESVKDLIIMPDNYMLAGKPNVSEWMASDEILHVIYGIHYSGLDLDLLMNGGNQQEAILDEVKKLATKQETATEHKPVDELLKSQIMHYTLSGFIIPKTDGSEGLISGVEIYVPATSLVDGNNKLIKTTEITSVIVNIPALLDAVNPYLNEGADKGKVTPLINRLTDGGLIDKLLKSSDIVHGTLVNTIGGVLTGESVKDIIVMPEGYVTANKPNVDVWIDSNEILNVIYGIHYSGLNIDNLMSTGGNKQDLMLEEIKAMSKKQRNPEEAHKPVDELLKSNIMYYTLSGAILPQEGKDSLISGINIVVPKDALNKDVPTLVSKIEITNVVMALPALLNPLDKFQNDNSIDGLVKSLTTKDEELKVVPTEEVYKSLILKYTLADKLTDELSSPAMSKYVVLPTGYVDMVEGNPVKNLDEWFKNGTNEIDALLQALITSKLELDGAVSGKFDTTEQINKFAAVSAEDLTNKVFGSRVIHYTVSGLLAMDDLGVKIIIPTASKDDTDTKLVKKAELVNLMKSVPTILNNIKDTTALVKEIVNDTNTKGNDAMLKQPILLTTIVNYLNTNVFNSMDMITVPKSLKDAAVEKELIAYTSANPWGDEVGSLISALDLMVFPADPKKEFDITDSVAVMANLSANIKTLNNIDAGDDKTRLQKVYASKIMKATLASNMDSALNDTILDIDAFNSIKALDGDYKYIPDTEMAKLVNATVELDIDLLNMNTDDLIAKLNTLNSKATTDTTATKVNVIYRSEICKLILTKQLDTQLATLVNDVNKLDAKEALNTKTAYNVYTTTEIETIIQAFGPDYLNIDFASPNLEYIYLDNLDTIVKNSNILKGVLTKQLASVSAIVIPEEVYAGKEYISGDECAKMVNILASNKTKLFETKDFGNGVVKAKLTTFTANNLTLNVLSSLLGSDILHATAIKQVANLGISAIVIPTEYKTAADNIATSYNNKNLWIKNSEVQNLVSALGVFIGNDSKITELNTEIILAKVNGLLDENKVDPTKTNLDIAYQSNIIKATMAPQLDSVFSKVLTNDAVLSDSRVKAVIVGTNTLHYKDTEVKAIFSALKNTLKIKDVTDFDPVTVTNNIVQSTHEDVVQLNNSIVVWNIISEQLNSVFAGMKVNDVVLTHSYDSNETLYTVYTVEAVDNIFGALRTLVPDMKGLDGIGATVKNAIFDLTTDSIKEIRKSDIIWDVLTTQLDTVLTTAGINSLVIEAAKEQPYTDSKYKAYKSTEILNLIEAAKALGLNDLDGMTGGSNMLLGDKVDIATAYSKSDIVKDLISSKLNVVLDGEGSKLKKHSTSTVLKTYETGTVEFFTEADVTHLVGFMKELNVTDFGAFDLTGTLSAAAIEHVALSSILNATISSNLFTTKAFRIPESALSSLNIETEKNKMLDSAELTALLTAMFSIAGISLDNQNMDDTFKPSSITDENIAKLVASKIMRAKITEIISAASAFTVAEYCVSIETIMGTTNNMYVLSGNEIQSFIKALKKFGAGDTFKLSFDLNAVLGYSAADIYTITDSNIATNLLTTVVVAGGLHNKAYPQKEVAGLPVISIVGRDGTNVDYELQKFENPIEGLPVIPGHPIPTTITYGIKKLAKVKVYTLGPTVTEAVEAEVVSGEDILALKYLIANIPAIPSGK